MRTTSYNVNNKTKQRETKMNKALTVQENNVIAMQQQGLKKYLKVMQG